jgi:hypothetical protein
MRLVVSTSSSGTASQEVGRGTAVACPSPPSSCTNTAGFLCSFVWKLERQRVMASNKRRFVPLPSHRARGAEATMEVTSGTAVDGFIWRKYGQKDINGHKHPRQVDSFTRGSGRELSCRSI